MSDPYIGEIRMFAGSFAPAGWAFCDGQLMPISQNDALFTLIGTTYGGDGQETFALPDCRGRAPMHMGTGPDGVTYQLAETGGVESVTLTIQQIPVHNHALVGTADPATELNPQGNLLGTSPAIKYVRVASPVANMNAQTISPVGGSQPHDNMQPYLAISFIMSLFGVFPHQ